MDKLKILELTNFSAGGCGVWARVRQEALLLSNKGYEVRVFSSNLTKGSNKLAIAEEKIENVRVSRFPAIKLGGESFMVWDFKKEALDFSPDIIIAHVYRHPHTRKALKIAKALQKKGKNCKVFLVTHAPFERSDTRSLISKSIVYLYDKIYGKAILNKFNKIIFISKWEVPYLKKIGVEENKLFYSPNGVSEIFFKPTKQNYSNKLIYTGRISPIKNIELIIKSFHNLKGNITLEIFGPAEKDYLISLEELIKKLNLKDKIKINNTPFNLKEQITKLDNSGGFILPSKSEGMPISLIEAMSRGKICITSDNLACRDIIDNNKNGLLFKNNDLEDLKKILLKFISLSNLEINKISKEARKTAEKFKWRDIISNLEKLF